MYSNNSRDKETLDKLLRGLYNYYLYHDGEGFARITAIIPDRKDWRIIAGVLYEEGLLVFSSGENNGCAAKLTNKGLNFCKYSSFAQPNTSLLHP